MDFNVNQFIRSLVVLAVGLPITIGVAASVFPEEDSLAQEVVSETKGSLTKACLEYALSDNDSKMEREAKTTIDNTFGDGANYGEVCRWVLS